METSCENPADVVIVLELPPRGHYSSGHVAEFFSKLIQNVHPKKSCIRIGVITSTEKASVLTKLDCHYTQGGCFSKAIEELVTMGSALNGSKTSFDAPGNKQVLLQAIELGEQQLSSQQDGARNGIKKMIILVVSNPPVKEVTPIQKAVESIHIRGIELLAIGVDSGKKEKLEDIIIAPDLLIEVDNLRDLKKKAIIWTIAYLIKLKRRKGKQ